MKFLKRFVLAAFLVAALLSQASTAMSASSDLQSPVGLWRTMDDATGKPTGVVRVYLQDGKYFGKLEQSFTPGDDARACEKCKDERKGQPLIGLLILRNMIPQGNGYEGGDILDPANGAVYKCKLRLEDSGKKLLVRGYIGFSLMGRTQVWERLK